MAPAGEGPQDVPALAMLEMRVVLQTIIAAARLAPARTEPEAIRNQSILFAPAPGGEAVSHGRR